MLRTLGLISGVIALVGVTAPQAERVEPPQLAGIYTSHGVNADGSKYRGYVRIETFHETLLIRWTFPTSNSTVPEASGMLGIGIVSGNVIAVSYYGESIEGVAVYQVEEGGQRLVGRWAALGDAQRVNAETLTRMPDWDGPSVTAPRDDEP